MPTHGNAFFLFTVLMGLIYNLYVIFKSEVVYGDYKLLSAGVIGVITCFIVFNGGIVTLMYVKNLNFIDANAFGIYLDNEYLLKYASVTGVGNIFLWLGYSSRVGDYLFSIYYNGFGYKKILHLDIDVVFPKLLIAIGVFSNVILFANGAFGRGTAIVSQLTGPIKYFVAFSSYIEKIALIGYFLLAMIYFKTGEHRRWYWGSLIIMAMFALVSGARGPVIFLFILTALPYYYIKKKLSWKLVGIGLGTFLVAFTIASELKVFTQSLQEQDVAISDYAGQYIEFRDESSEKIDAVIYNSVYYSIMRRLNTVAQGSVAIKYKDQHGIDKTDPKFLSELVTIPLYTVIPRSKLGSAFPSWGQWFRLKVLKQRNDTYANNITFGAVAYFYMTGKWFFVAFGFFMYGLVLRFSNNILQLNSGISFLVYLAILSTIGYISASVPSSFVSFLRFVIFLPLFFYVIIKISNRLRL